jgi:hypothetical protein
VTAQGEAGDGGHRECAGDACHAGDEGPAARTIVVAVGDLDLDFRHVPYLRELDARRRSRHEL